MAQCEASAISIFRVDPQRRCFGLGAVQRVKQSKYGPSRSGRRYPLVFSMRKAAVEIRLKRPGPAPHEPRAVRELSPQQKRDPALADRIVELRSSRFLQGEERLTGRPGVTLQAGQLRPAAVGPLRTYDAPGHAPLFGRLRAAPTQPQQFVSEPIR